MKGGFQAAVPVLRRHGFTLPLLHMTSQVLGPEALAIASSARETGGTRCVEKMPLVMPWLGCPVPVVLQGFMYSYLTTKPNRRQYKVHCSTLYGSGTGGSRAAAGLGAWGRT